MSEPLPEGWSSVRIEFRRDRIGSLGELITTLAAIEELRRLAFELALGPDGPEVGQFPVVRVQKMSPLWVELRGLLWPEGLVPMGLGLFAWMVKHPEDIGGFVPNVVAGWRRGWAQADQAQDERRIQQAAAAGRTLAEAGDADVDVKGPISPDLD